MAGLSSLTVALGYNYNWTGTLSRTGANFQPVTVADNFTDTFQFGTAGQSSGSNNNLSATGVAGADEIVARIISLTASGGGTPSIAIDLTNLTGTTSTGTADILNQTVTLARVKAIRIQLLSTTQDATNGTAASSITVGNNGSNDLVTQASTGAGWFGTAASTMVIPNGGRLSWEAPNATGVATTSAGTPGVGKIIKIANNDAVNAAAVRVELVGGTN